MLYMILDIKYTSILKKETEKWGAFILQAEK